MVLDIEEIMKILPHRPPMLLVDKILEIVSREVRSAIGTVDPELICVRSELTPNMQKIREKVAERIPEKYIPELVYIDPDQFQELILLGQMIITLEELEK